MKKHLITVMLLAGGVYSFSQAETHIQETNIDHNGISLGVNSYDGGILYSKKDGKYKKIDSYSLFYTKMIDSVTFDIDKESKLENVNISINNGSPSIYENELYYTANSGSDVDYNANNYVDYTVSKDGENTLQIFISNKNEQGEWEFPTYVSFSNIEHNFTTPYISEDGNKLYFASDKPGGFGGYDIYVSEREEDLSWGEPKNLGKNVNSPLNEAYPFLQGNTLYFSSKKDEKSSTDIYFVTNNGEWNTKKELTDINSDADDFGIRFISENTGYFSSNRDGEEMDKTFYFRITKEEEKIIAVNDVVEEVEETEKKADTLITEKKVSVDVNETKLVSSKAVYFDLNGARVKSEGRFELDKIAYKLNNNSKLVVEIFGYTDASGANDMNLNLSKKRAKAVEEYLAEKGISKTKIVDVKGYGEKNLINDCVDYSKCGEEANAMNRRVEVKILELLGEL